MKSPAGIEREDEDLRMNVTIDEEKCIGCGRCEEICPSVFHVDEAVG